jgi:chorismate synthase
LIKNRDYKIDHLADVYCPRPGHADLTGVLKYRVHDCRDILERASARETVSRVAMGALVKIMLQQIGIDLLSHVIELGGIKADTSGLSFDSILEKTGIGVSKLRCADPGAENIMCKKIDEAQAKGDTLGGIFEVVVRGLPPGLGSYTQWDERLDGRLGKALLSIPAVKAVSIGDAIESVSKYGSQVHDPVNYLPGDKKYVRETNHAGGLEGGMTNAMDIVLKGYMKPIATLKTPLDSIDIRSKDKAKASTERSDVTAVPACGVVAESVVAFEIASCVKEKFGGDSMEEMKRNIDSYLSSVKDR